MNNVIENKLNRMLQMQPQGTVYLSKTLERSGISQDLQKRYRSSGWLESIGYGAMKRPGESISWTGALYSLQKEGLAVHIGGLTALEIHGLGHYIRMGKDQVYLFSSGKVTLPRWFREYNWGVGIIQINTSFLPQTEGLTNVPEKNFEVVAANPIRAMLECLHLVPDKFDIMEAFEIMESMRGMIPSEVQQLLSASQSVKVNRIFLFLARRAGHSWLKYLNEQNIKLGKGKRQIVKDGKLDKRYLITIPPELNGS